MKIRLGEGDLWLDWQRVGCASQTTVDVESPRMNFRALMPEHKPDAVRADIVSASVADA